MTEPKWRSQAQMAGVDIDFKADLSPLPFVTGNEVELREILCNLIFNAVDAIPARGGAISVRTRCVGQSAELVVHDTGVGMTDEIRQRCMDPFFTTKGARNTGLGLTLVFGVVKRLSGTIEIESAPGQGTTVTLRLPLCLLKRERKPVLAPNMAQVMRVLLVDDEPLVREIVGDLLAQDGHLFDTATDGFDALAKFSPDAFDLVLTDRCMPGMNGDLLAARIKAMKPSMPVIMMTGVGDFMNSPPQDVDVLVNKPLGLNDLRRAFWRVKDDVKRSAQAVG
jgi:CheY-like chemotaxis protein